MQLAVIALLAVLVLGLVAAGAVVVRHRRKLAVAAPRRPVRPERPITAATQMAQPGSVLSPSAPAEVFPPSAAGPESSDRVEFAVEAFEPVVAPPPSFRDRLSKARAAIAGPFRAILVRPSIDGQTWEELEEALIKADVGVELTRELLDTLRQRAKVAAITEPEALLQALKDELKARLAGADRSLCFEAGTPNVWLFVGVNGVGKTTTVGKVGFHQAQQGRSVLMAAGDTFRAAAAEQLQAWAERAGTDFVRGAEGGDPSSVVFDSVQRAAARGIDLVLADTAGRLHTKSNLMDELAKVRRVAAKEPGRLSEVLLVLDAVTGQNGLVQAQQFTEATELTGVVLTKLDGSAKGGIVLAIEARLGIPVKLVGLGEGINDLVGFDPDEFVDALFD